ncbi:hypothetical protein [Novosphingobium sp.]|uniref:hypothetical protein n=1 Tax=Novosphingobium sp. TaxID=1874826 RepID=UPI0038B95A35
MKYFSPSTRGFYALETNAGFIPDDAVEIDDALHIELIAGQAEGKQIIAGDDGIPMLADPPEPSDDDKKAVCKAAARKLLVDTDYTQVADVDLKNQAAFTAYRASVRQLLINPVADPVWPELPVPIWGD